MMQYIDFQNKLLPLKIFTLTDIEKFYGTYHPRRLNEWQKKGYIIKIRNGFYYFSKIPITENFLFLIANKIYEPSYISLESALSIYNIVPEGVYSVISLTTRKTIQFITPMTTFFYRNIKANLFFGFQLLSHKDRNFKIATPEKAVLDYLYLNSNIKTIEDIEGLRWNREVLKNLDQDKLKLYLELFSSKILNQKFFLLQNYLK